MKKFLVVLSVLFVSCTEDPRLESLTYCYISNNTDKVVGIKVHGAPDIIEPRQSRFQGRTPGYNPASVFCIKPEGPITIIFNDSIEEVHYQIPTDSGYVKVPSEHNILDYQAWEVDDVKQVATYTITEEDYQRALEQSKTLKANLSDNTTAAQIDELLDNYNGLGF